MRRRLCLLLAGLPTVALSQWVPQQSGTSERLRAVSAVSSTIVWASGNHGTIVRSTDAGTHWVSVGVPGTDSLDFRLAVVRAPRRMLALDLAYDNELGGRLGAADPRLHCWLLNISRHESRQYFTA